MKGDSRRVTRWGDPSMETFTAPAKTPVLDRNSGETRGDDEADDCHWDFLTRIFKITFFC